MRGNNLRPRDNIELNDSIVYRGLLKRMKSATVMPTKWHGNVTLYSIPMNRTGSADIPIQR
jgi:hypothetical protein